jgi:hypothetical protein
MKTQEPGKCEHLSQDLWSLVESSLGDYKDDDDVSVTTDNRDARHEEDTTQQNAIATWYWKYVQTNISKSYSGHIVQLQKGNASITKENHHNSTLTDEALGLTILLVYAEKWDAEISNGQTASKVRPAGQRNLSTDKNKIVFNSVFRCLVDLRKEPVKEDEEEYESAAWYGARTDFETEPDPRAAF